MRYFITAYTDDKLKGALEQVANDVPSAMRKARELIETSSFSVAIRDCYGNKISGDDLIACCKGTKRLSRDLKATEPTRTEGRLPSQPVGTGRNPVQTAPRRLNKR